MNGSFVLYGVLLALGALLLAGRLTTSRSGRVALVLLDAERAGGLAERVGLWPAFVALAVLGASWLRTSAAPAPRPA